MLEKKDYITVNNSIQRFVHKKTGDIFVPIGVNYFPRGTGWAPKIWNRSQVAEYERDFPRIKALGMNIIRVFLSFKKLMPQPNQMDQNVLTYIRELLECAEKYDIRVIFSGPSAWDGTPEWAEPLKETWDLYYSDSFILEQLSFCWSKVAEVCKDFSSMFSYDLFNEPAIPWKAKGYEKLWADFVDKLVAKETDSSKIEVLKAHKDTIPENNFKGNREVLYAYQMFRNQISYDFCKICCDSIRSVDENHMITIGSHQCTVPLDCGAPSRFVAFDPHYIGDLLDYVSLHFYPYDEAMDIGEDINNFEKCQNLFSAYINYMDIGKPIMLEEFGLYGGGAAPDFPWRPPFKYLSQQVSADWVCKTIVRNRSKCSGFLNWGFDDHPDCKDPTRYQGFYDDDGNIKELGKAIPAVIKSTNEYISGSPAYIKKTPLELDVKDILTSQEACWSFVRKVIDGYDKLDNPYIITKNI